MPQNADRQKINSVHAHTHRILFEIASLTLHSKPLLQQMSEALGKNGFKLICYTITSNKSPVDISYAIQVKKERYRDKLQSSTLLPVKKCYKHKGNPSLRSTKTNQMKLFHSNWLSTK